MTKYPENLSTRVSHHLVQFQILIDILDQNEDPQSFMG